MQLQIAHRQVGEGCPPLIVAEMSGNHNQSLDRALAIVDAVARSGAHALKLQTYTADTMTLDVHEREFFISDPSSLWKGHSLYQLYEKACTPWQWHEPIFRRCRELGLLAFSTPFDASAVDFLETLDVPCYKIASFENVDLPLIRRVAQTGKPIIISTGMATIAELDEAVAAATGAGCRDLMLLKCTSSYPASAQNSNLATIPHMRDLFGCHIGLSDHTLGIGVAVASVALGAVAIEKHVTLRRSDAGVDAEFSLEPDELRLLVDETHRAWQALGSIRYGAQEQEQAALAFRRSLYVRAGHASGRGLHPDNLRAVRPGRGLAPKFLEVLLGRKVNRDVKKGTAVSWEMVGERP